MEGKQNEKITFISSRQLSVYRVWLWGLMSLAAGVIGFGIFQLFFVNRGGFGGIMLGFVSMFHLVRIFPNIKVIEFDKEFLYVLEKDYDIVMPLENIKTIELKTLGGFYRILLFDKIQSGHEIYFMPSLIYPLDFNKQDEKVNILRSYVWKAKQVTRSLPRNALNS